MLQRVVFLDRDGVINRDSPDYIKCVEEFEFLPGSLEALRHLAGCGFSPIVVTNQSGLHRGLFSPETLAEIHRRMCAAVRRRRPSGRWSAPTCPPRLPYQSLPACSATAAGAGSTLPPP
jgi:histidinol-phosphate phosphatase family protein